MFNYELEKYSEKVKRINMQIPPSFCILQPKIEKEMTVQLLNSFYDTFQYGLGMTLCWVFMFLMTIELIYVMAKYLGGKK